MHETPPLASFLSIVQFIFSFFIRRFRLQEGTRKDIERVFGVLKGTWKFMERPILLMDLKHIALSVTTCIILHTMLVPDRVMESVGVVYDPANVSNELEDAMECVQ
jgi:Plant transposon protein